MIDLSQLSGNERIFAQTLSIVVTAVAGFVTVFLLNRSRLIEDTPTSLIRSAAQGQVEIVGQVVCDQFQPIHSPLSGKPCVWFEYEVQRHQQSGKDSRWKTISSGRSNNPFQVIDESGSCFVDPAGASIITNHSHSWRGSTPMPTQSTSTHFASYLTDSDYRYTETLIREFEPVYLLGYFSSEGAGRHLPPLQQIKGDIIRQWKSEYHRLLERFDKDDNGDIDQQEWSNVQLAAETEAKAQRDQLSKLPTQHWLRKSPVRGMPFIISTKSQKELAGRYRWMAAASAALMAGSTYLMFHLFS